MTVPNATATATDGGLAQAAPSSGKAQISFGVCSAGVPNTVYGFSTPDDCKAQLGVGPLVECGAFKLQTAGGPQYFVPVNPSVAGTCGTVTATRAAGGPSTGTVAASGNPYDAYPVQVQIVTGEATLAAGTGTFKYSLDGGSTWSALLAIPTGGTYAIPNTGIILTFAYSTGTAFIVGDLFAFTCKAPGYAASDLLAAIAAAAANPSAWGFGHILGAPTAGTSSVNASASAALATAIDTTLQGLVTGGRFVSFLMEAPDSVDADLISAFANFGSDKGGVVVAAGYAMVTSAVSGKVYKRSALWPVMARAGKTAIGQSLAAVEDGPLPGIVSLLRDEFLTPGLDDARFLTLRSFLKRTGFYVNLPKTMAPLGSDYSQWQYRRLIDAARASVKSSLEEFLNSKVRVNDATSGENNAPPGSIYEPDAVGIETYCQTPLTADLTDPVDGLQVTSSSVQVNRTDNLITTSRLRAKVRLTPDAYLGELDADVGFDNPGITAIAS